MRFQWCSTVFLISPCLWAKLINTTVDDNFAFQHKGQTFISYSPPDAWVSKDDCKECNINPNLLEASAGTWHEGTFNPTNDPKLNTPLTATFQFFGSAVYFFGIVPPSDYFPEHVTSLIHLRLMTDRWNSRIMELKFLVNQQEFPDSVFSPNATNTYDYNVLIFSASLGMGNHTITLQSAPKDQKSFVILDYITYTYDDGSPIPEPTVPVSAKNSSNPSAKIIGGVLGTTCIILLAIIAYLLLRGRKVKNSNLTDTPSPVRQWSQKREVQVVTAQTDLPFDPSLFAANSGGNYERHRPRWHSLPVPAHRNFNASSLYDSSATQDNQPQIPTVPCGHIRHQSSSSIISRLVPQTIIQWRRRIANEALDPALPSFHHTPSIHIDRSTDDYQPLEPPMAARTRRRFIVVNV